MRLWLVSAVFAVFAAVAAVFAPTDAKAQRTPAVQDICLARWQIDSKPGVPAFWNHPFRSESIARLDLRSKSAKTSTATPGGWGIFTYGKAMGSTGMHCFGGDPGRILTQAEVDTLTLVLGKGVASIQGNRSLGEVLAMMIRDLGDVTGQSSWEPKGANLNGYSLYIGDFLLYHEPYSFDSVSFQRTLEHRKAVYADKRAKGESLDALRRWNGYDLIQYFGSLDGSKLHYLVPSEYLSDGYIKPETQKNDDFTGESSTVALDSHTPAGSGAGDSWTLIFNPDSGVINVQGSAADVQESGVGDIIYRMNNDLSSDEHYSEIIDAACSVNSGTRAAATILRKDGTATLDYYWGNWSPADGGMELYTVSGGTPSFITSFTQAWNCTSPADLKIQLDDTDTITAFFNGSSIGTAGSETDHFGNLRTAMGLRQDGAGIFEAQDYNSADLAAAPVGQATQQVIVINWKEGELCVKGFCSSPLLW